MLPPFTVAPTITAVSPSELPLAGGLVTVSGSFFADGATDVRIGLMPCTAMLVLSSTSLTCEVSDLCLHH